MKILIQLRKSEKIIEKKCNLPFKCFESTGDLRFGIFVKSFPFIIVVNGIGP